MDTQHNTGANETPISASIRHLLDHPLDVKLHLLQHHAERARLLAEEILDEEIEALTGERYERKPSENSLRRWGTNPGSIRIDGERVPTAGFPAHVPRVRDTKAGKERPLQSYQAMKKRDVPDELAEAILLGISQGDDERVALS